MDQVYGIHRKKVTMHLIKNNNKQLIKVIVDDKTKGD